MQQTGNENTQTFQVKGFFFNYHQIIRTNLPGNLQQVERTVKIRSWDLKG